MEKKCVKLDSKIRHSWCFANYALVLNKTVRL